MCLLPHEARGIGACDLTTEWPHRIARCPKVSVIDPRGGKRIDDALEGATVWWGTCSPLLFKVRSINLIFEATAIYGGKAHNEFV
jgi:hypothetical protein